jgi:hypothetical protein|tara:strand:- start:97 stop:834 length:738 start_codon:yes stop_codon:yes gene_type:complete
MTANEMADRVLIQIDRMAAGYEDSELSAILNKAQYQFIKSNQSPLTNPKREGLEESEVRNQGFSALVDSASLTPAGSSTNDNLSNGVFVDLPTDFMLPIFEEVTVSATDCDGNNLVLPVDVIAHNQYNKIVSNPYRRPFVDKSGGSVWRLQVGRVSDGNAPLSSAQTAKRHELITDGTFTVSNYKLRYLKTPPEMVVDFATTGNQRNCILDESTHEAIVGIASDLLMSATGRQVIPNIQPIQNIE